MKRNLVIPTILLLATPLAAQDKITPEQLEFFEKKVRPVLVQHCFECHAATSKRVKGGLRVDSRAGLLEGGDNGPAIVPGQPEKSRLIEAIRYTNVDLKMPKNGKLPAAILADLTAWVKMGAPWPEEKLVKKSTYKEFDLHKRRKEHWCWQPIRVEKTPAVRDGAWPKSEIDRFLLAKLEAKGLKPATDADPRTLLRRLHFDLIGLPPSRTEVEEFVNAWEAAGANRQDVLARTVDRLLDSPRFGERWARHWLDLVRYAESRGHEFDYTIPNAFQYRDYVIRAFNSDVPYDRFVTEHLAGDLIKSPRLNVKEGYDESILGTAFWFLGEEVHSPVDIRQDQADRFDNRIDVMTKTFLGLTVACARCHDHKFDAISTRDYYALFGILESSNYRLARFDTLAQNRKVAEEMWAVREKSRPSLLSATSRAAEGAIGKLDGYLLAAAGLGEPDKSLNPALVTRWKQALSAALKDETSPIHLFARATVDKSRKVPDVVNDYAKRWPALGATFGKDGELVIDYRASPVKNWLPDGVSYGPRPVRPGEIVLGASPERPIARIIEQGAAEFDRAWDGLRLKGGAQNESGSLGGALRSGRTLRTPNFQVKQGRVFAWLKGAGMIYAGVGQHIMLAGPLHGRLVQRFNTGNRFQWVAVDLATYQGQTTHLEFTPNENTDFAVVAIVQTPATPAPLVAPLPTYLASTFARAETHAELAKAYAKFFGGVSVLMNEDKLVASAHAAELAQAANWLVQHADLFIEPNSEGVKSVADVARPILDSYKKLSSAIQRDARLTPAMQDGSGTNEYVFIRGNPKTLGPLVPRRHLESLVGADPLPVKVGSGRLELAKQMTDPAITPFITRVYVNRVWHHLFGRGIVGSVDNFGVLGEMPTHPELLDYLAHRFSSPGDQPGAGFSWSTKKLIRALVLTRAYQMASTPSAKADEVDPENLLLHRMRIRRLQGEAIRDSILRVSGRLNPAMYGPSVPVYLTPFQDGRGRPGSGPLDGDGRRSVYLAVRRNFLSSFLLAFDTPSPFSTVGRRTVSNVPAQALIMMNDPFVHQQAEVWAKRVLAEKGTVEDRVRGMFVDAFARSPSATESQACVTFLGATPDARRWADLGHVLMNTKEFYFVN